MASPSVREGLYRCSRALGRSFVVHVGLGARTSSSGGAQGAVAHQARRTPRGARRAVSSWAFRDRRPLGPVELLRASHLGFMTRMYLFDG